MGVLSVFGKISQADPSEEEMALLTTIADLAGVVVESARLRQRAPGRQRTVAREGMRRRRPFGAMLAIAAFRGFLGWLGSPGR